jgi:transposase-like protein
MEEQPPIKGNRVRRSYSKAFKAALVERCHGLNANLLQK